MDDRIKLASALWQLESTAPLDLRQPEQRQQVWNQIAVLHKQAILRYVGAPLWEKSARNHELRDVTQRCRDLQTLLKSGGPYPEIPPGSTQPNGPQTQGNAMAQGAPQQLTNPGEPQQAGPPQPGMDPNQPAPPQTQVDQVAMMIEQALAQGAQLAPTEIVNALQQAAAQDQQTLLAGLHGQVQMHAQRLMAAQPAGQQISTGAQLLNAGFPGSPQAGQYLQQQGGPPTDNGSPQYPLGQ